MAKSYPYPSGKGSVKWVTAEWLEDHLQENITLLDAQPNIHDYILEHIPGAIYLNEEFLRCSEGGLCGTFMPPDAVERYLRQVGIRPDRGVVVYTGQGLFKKWGDGLEQTMMAYGLARFGHENIMVLDGGLEEWKAGGRRVTKEFPKTESSDYRASVRSDLFIHYDEFKRVKDEDNVVLLDARPSAIYEGQGPWIKPGHIPGAISLPWASLMTKDNTRKLRPDEEIIEAVEKVGATKDRDIICSCGTGREATNELLLFKYYLGYPSVRIYEGSFTEWTSYPENPTVVGASPNGPLVQRVQPS